MICETLGRRGRQQKSSYYLEMKRNSRRFCRKPRIGGRLERSRARAQEYRRSRSEFPDLWTLCEYSGSSKFYPNETVEQRILIKSEGGSSSPNTSSSTENNISIDINDRLQSISNSSSSHNITRKSKHPPIVYDL